jgi:predicted permease
MLTNVIVFLINAVIGINAVEIFVLVLFSDTPLGIMALDKSGLTTRGVNLINTLNSNSRNSALIGPCNFS